MEFLYNGGLQIRSEEASDKLLNVKSFLEGDLSLSDLYSSVLPSDYPIAQDCFGDQFLIRNDLVVKLMAETGEIEQLNYTWEEFLSWVNEDPYNRLDLPEDLELETGNYYLLTHHFVPKKVATQL